MIIRPTKAVAAAATSASTAAARAAGGFDGVFVRDVGTGAAFVVVAEDRAWLVEDGLLLPLHEGEPRPAPAYLALGDVLEGSRVDWVVRLEA